ncbi:hypothetical protein [Haladaptatus sp. CMAA 1909]|uniref:hypothetical protein n=1 Tax=Haladaptatus sp. CMAA 1909 TaxID=3368986 RepID=UPI003753F918
MNADTTTGRLPSRVAWTVATVSVVIGIAVSEYLGAGLAGNVLATLVLMAVLALAYEVVAS